MNDQQYFLTTSLSYQLKVARRELADFRSGEIYRKLRGDYEGSIRELNLTVKKLKSGMRFLSHAQRSQSSGPMFLRMSEKNRKKKPKK